MNGNVFFSGKHSQPSSQLKLGQFEYEDQWTVNGKNTFSKTFFIDLLLLMLVFHTVYYINTFAGITSQEQNKCIRGLPGDAEDQLSHNRGLHLSSGEWKFFIIKNNTSE